MELTHGSLFSGIGGFDLGFERVVFKSLWQVEIDDYATKVLEKNFPDAQRFGTGTVWPKVIFEPFSRSLFPQSK